MTAFADTFALIAWLNPRDNAHAAVTAYLDGFTGRLLTTEWVLVELADALSAPRTRSRAVDFIRAIRSDPLFEVIGYDQAVYRAGFELFAFRQDKAWSLTDCISFAVMAQRQLIDALTEDHHFEQAGFWPVFAQPKPSPGIEKPQRPTMLTESHGFVTYENRANKHVTIHGADCTQIRKRGGEHKYGDGKYEDHLSYADARKYAQQTGLEPIIDCSYCKPLLEKEKVSSD